MTFQINVLSIDETFPKAGKDNSSQGFRDNFAAIKGAITTATHWLTDLDNRTSKLNTANDFGHVGTLENAILKGTVGKVKKIETPKKGEIGVVFKDGPYQKSAPEGDSTYRITWPDSSALPVETLAKVTLEITPTVQADINFAAVGGDVILREPGLALPYFSVPGVTTIWDLWTTDNGKTMFVKLAGGPFFSRATNSSNEQLTITPSTGVTPGSNIVVATTGGIPGDTVIQVAYTPSTPTGATTEFYLDANGAHSSTVAISSVGLYKFTQRFIASGYQTSATITVVV